MRSSSEHALIRGKAQPSLRLSQSPTFRPHPTNPAHLLEKLTKQAIFMTALLCMGCIQQPNTQLTTQIAYSPPIVPLTVPVNSQCEVSVQIANKIVTPVGVFEASVVATMEPEPEEMLLIIRRHNKNDTVYNVAAGSHIEFNPAQIMQSFSYEQPLKMIITVPFCNPPHDALETNSAMADMHPEKHLEPAPQESLEEHANSGRRPPDNALEPESLVAPTVLPYTATHVLSIGDFARRFQPSQGWHFAQIEHPYTGITFQISFFIPSSDTKVFAKRNEIRFQSHNYDLVFDFRRDGRLDLEYR